ncbi:MAG: Gfo/Idh/MocA family oxidoreductase, partial [Lentisphaeria bacterium]|nr:Gfo/Idh/MocA family oxidoreductase [Lentisphaeria bacterium]
MSSEQNKLRANPMKLLLVGSGNIASTYLNAVRNVPEVEITGIVSRSGKVPSNAPEGIKVYPSITEAASLCDFEGVILATPNGCHAPGCLEASGLGKHVFTEKTLALTREDMDTMIRTCREKNLKLAVAFQRRTAPDNIIVRDLIRKNAFGKLVACELSVNFWRDNAYYENSSYRGNLSLDGGGPFVQQASHNLDLYTWFFGLPEKLHAFTGTFLHTMEGEDYGSAILLHKNGMIGNIIASTASKPGFDAVMTLRTEKGTLTLEGDRITYWQIEGMENPSVSRDLTLHSGSSTNAVTS